MIFHTVRGDLKSADPKDVATAIFDFFQWQYNQTREEQINRNCELAAWRAANHAAEETYRNSGELGWGPKLPYSEAQLKLKEEEVTRANHHLNEARLFLNFIRDRFVEKFIL